MTAALRVRWIVSIAVAAAALLMASTARAGLIGTGPAAYCDPTASQPFERWDDDAFYALTPGGSFETGPAWSLSGGARVVSGNEPFFVRAATDSRSLLLPAGSSAMSPSMCFALGDWHARFFVRNVGSSTGRLAVTVVVPSLVGGVLSVLDGDTITADGAWQPSERIELLLSNASSLVGTRAVAFRFTPVGPGAAFQIDDVYLDPWKCT